MTDQDTAVLSQRVAALEAENARLQAAVADGAIVLAERSAALMAGVQHRVRNMLATIRAIVSRTMASEYTAEEFAAHLLGRLDTLARLQGALTRTDNAGLDLEELVREEFVAQGGFGPGQIEVEGPSVTLRDQVAELLGMAVHELAANAVKFGALSTASGRVAVRWRVQQQPDQTQLVLSWDESGAPSVTHGSHEGFGRQLIEKGLPYQLSARTSFELRPGGLQCAIELPIGNS